MNQNFHEILGVPPNASQAQIRHAFLELAKECHPDLHPDDPEAAAKFELIDQAFEKLYRPWLRSFRRGRSSNSGTTMFEKVARRARPHWKCDPCAVELVKIPAICLILFGVVLPLSVWIWNTSQKERWENQRQESYWNRSELPEGQIRHLDREFANRNTGFEWLARVVSVSFSLPMAVLWGMLIITGGINLLYLQNYALAIGASILAALPFCVGLWFPVGLLIGGWILARIHDPVVKHAFRT